MDVEIDPLYFEDIHWLARSLHHHIFSVIAQSQFDYQKHFLIHPNKPLIHPLLTGLSYLIMMQHRS